MRLGLIGWGTATGNGGMNSDIAHLAKYVTKWMIPSHPEHPYHLPYINRCIHNTKVYFSSFDSCPEDIELFFSDIDGILYVEHPIYRSSHFSGYDLILDCLSRGKSAFGIPMWEWWPEEAEWAQMTSALWAPTRYTLTYLKALQTILYSRGYEPLWKNSVYGSYWGVDCNEFRYKNRKNIESIAYVNGQGGYKCRKASDIIIPCLSRMAQLGANVKIYTQTDLPSFPGIDLITIKSDNHDSRSQLYLDDDLFVFSSYWEGLCHGIYEAAYSGGIVVTTNDPPMNELVPALTINVEEVKTESLDKKIRKGVPSGQHLYHLLQSVIGSECSDLSLKGHQWVLENRNLSITLLDMYSKFQAYLLLK